MPGAAVLRAKEMIPAGPRGLEPGDRVAPGHDVFLHAERGHEEVVDHVLGGHREAHGAPDRHVQLVDLALPVGMLDLPHPLLADDGDLDRVVRGAVHREDDDEDRDQEREETADGEKVEIERVDARRHGGSLFGEERDRRAHQPVFPAADSAALEASAAASRRWSRRHMTARNVERMRTATAPPKRSMFMTTAPYFPTFGS